jgi:hypothetical protein
MNQTVPNVGASMVTTPTNSEGRMLLPKHQAFMALENGNFPLAINTGTDRDLSKNWELLPANLTCEKQQHPLGYNCLPNVACPSARYNPIDQYYYVFGGGNDITLTRSKDLTVWEKRNMSMMTHCIAEEICLKYRPPCTVRVFRRALTLEDAIGSRAGSLEALAGV